jgi:hypothetical protein
MNASQSGRIERPPLTRYGPNRGATTFYRAAVDDPHAIGGVQLDSAEAVATAAIRLGYRIADAQVSRVGRIASRLREAGDQATGGSGDDTRSDKKALDATEQLIFKTMLSGLSFLEGMAADRANPLRRLATAQFQILGSLLGLLPSERTAGSAGPTPPAPPARHEPPQAPAAPAGPWRDPRGHPPRIKHASAREERRHVQLSDWSLPALATAKYELLFHGADPAGAFSGSLQVSRRDSLLTVHASIKTPAGAYKAAVCDDDGVQLGFIELTV